MKIHPERLFQVQIYASRERGRRERNGWLAVGERGDKHCMYIATKRTCFL